MLLGGNAHAHDLVAESIPLVPGWRIGAAAALTGVQASPGAWPTPFYGGVLGSGQVPADRRGGSLEHAALDLGLRLNATWGASLALGKHGSDRAHVEDARLEARLPLGGDWRLAAGRSRVPMGDVIGGAGHLDRFALPPVAKQVMLGGDWIEDGGNLRWRSADPDSTLQSADLGLWRARTFPGGPDGRAAPAAHVQADWGDWRIDLLGASLAPTSRGTPVSASGSVHSHSVPDCRRDLSNLVCFDGDSHLAGLSVAWAPHGASIQARLAVLVQQESGALYSELGHAGYRGSTQGGWLDLIWRPRPGWEAAARLERLRAKHELTGPGASSVAGSAGLSPNRPVERAAAALAWTGWDDWRLSLEGGQERHAGGNNRWVGARLVWNRHALLGNAR